MDMHCVRALGIAISNYLRGAVPDPYYHSRHSERHAVNYTNAEITHVRLGPPSKDVTRRMEYKFPRTPCAICAQNKSVRAASNKTPAPKGKRPLDFVHIDIKVANTPDRHGNTPKLGIVDTCTKKSWVYTLRDGKASTVIAALKQWQVASTPQ